MKATPRTGPPRPLLLILSSTERYIAAEVLYSSNAEVVALKLKEEETHHIKAADVLNPK